MAWGRKKSGGRKEPLFGLPAALADLRLSPEDRIPAAVDDDKPKKSVPKRKHDEDDDEPRAARAQAARGERRRQAACEIARPVQVRPADLLGRGARPVGDDRDHRRRGLGRRASAGDPVAGNSKAPADHPDRRRRRQPAGLARRNGRHQCRAEGSAALFAEGVHRHRGPPLLFALRHRPRRHRARGGRQRHASRRLAGRLDADAAAREKPVPDPGTHDGAQAAGSGACAVAGAQALQERNSRALPQPRLFRFRRLWRRGRGAALFRQIRQERHGRGSRDAGGPRQVAVAAGAEPQPRRRGSARRNRARGDGGGQIHHRAPRPRPRSDIPPTR